MTSLIADYQFKASLCISEIPWKFHAYLFLEFSQNDAKHLTMHIKLKAVTDGL